ncbi:MAG: transposase [Anaerolineae bacterium]
MMTHDLNIHHRRSIRLKGYDYSQAGVYYVTIIAQDRSCLFGEIVDAEMRRNDAGKMLQTEWDALCGRFPNIELDEFVIMPNHIHGIIVITDQSRRGVPVRPEGISHKDVPPGEWPPATDATHAPTLANIVGAWKSITTDEYIHRVRDANWTPFPKKLWQRNYWEHIVRNDQDLNRIREYIANNPANWASDENNPTNIQTRMDSRV